MTADRIIRLCERLASATGTDVHWREDGQDRFSWQQVEGSVAIESRDKDGQPPYRLTIYNGSGALVDELSSVLLAGDEPAPWNDCLARLYRAARREALHADELIETLISLLHSNQTAEQV